VVSDDDVLFLGSYRFPVRRVHEFIDPGNDNPDSGVMRLPLEQATGTIGRGAGNDVVLDAPQVSRRHARLVRKKGSEGAKSAQGAKAARGGEVGADGHIGEKLPAQEWLLEDLGSANGTFVDGQRITRHRLEPGQAVSFGSYAVRLDLERG